MRPFEVLLAVLNLVAFRLLLLPRTRLMRTAQVLPFAAVMTAAGQYLWEGARWQLVPAYVVTVALLSYSMFSMRRYENAEHRAPPWVRIAFASVGVVALIFAIVLPAAIPVFGFPPPTGPYAIGTVNYHLVDQTRAEIFTVNPGDHRELMVQVWYPATASATAKRAPYVQDGKIIAPLAQLLRMPGFVFTHLRLVVTNAVSSAPVAVGAPRYPVLIFSPGRGGFRQHNTFQVEALVSHGYIVVAIDHPYAAAGVDFPDGRRVPLDPRMLNRRFIDSVIPYLAADVSFTLDQLSAINRADTHGILTGRLDLQHVGMFGVSLGGAVTAEVCLRDARLSACLPIDVFMPAEVVLHGLRQSTMWISRDAATMRREGWAESDILETQATMRSVFDGLKAPGYVVLIPGMFHQNFSDFPFFVASPLDRWLGLDGPINARRGHAIVNAYTLAFFDRHLREVRASSMLDGHDTRFSEVIFERHE